MGNNPGRTDRRTFLKTSSAVVAGAAVAGCIGDDDDDEVETIEVADFLPENHHIRRFSLLPWVDRVEELLDDDDLFDLHFAGELGGSGEMLSMARDGLSDITITPPAYFSGELSYSQVGNLAGTFEDTSVACEAFWNFTRDELYERELQDLNLRPVYVTVESPYQVGTLTGEPIQELEDWEGLSVRSTGGVMDMTVTALNASPVDIPPEDLYTSLERGTADAALLAQASVEVYETWDFYTHHTINASLGSWVAFWAMNHDTWDNLSSDVRDAMEDAADELAPQMGADYDEYHTSLNSVMADDHGIETYEVTDENLADWEEAMEEAHQEWIDTVGGDSDAVYDAWFDALESAR